MTEAARSSPILQTNALGKRFGGLHAVRDVSIALRVGELHCVIGPNGAGKSTLTNLLSGDLAPTSGTILLDDRDVTAEPVWALTSSPHYHAAAMDGYAVRSAETLGALETNRDLPGWHDYR